MIKRQIRTLHSLITAQVQNATNSISIPIKNKPEDVRLMNNLLRTMEIEKYGIKSQSMDEMIKCFYDSKQLKVHLDSNQTVTLGQLMADGNRILRSEVMTIKHSINQRNLRYSTGLQKSLLAEHKIGKIVQSYLKLKSIRGLVRVSGVKNKLLKKALLRKDHAAFNAVIGYLWRFNDEELMRTFIREEITKPTVRRLFGM